VDGGTTGGAVFTVVVVVAPLTCCTGLVVTGMVVSTAPVPAGGEPAVVESDVPVFGALMPAAGVCEFIELATLGSCARGGVFHAPGELGEEVEAVGV
jgi:hypothetical protein